MDEDGFVTSATELSCSPTRKISATTLVRTGDKENSTKITTDLHEGMFGLRPKRPQA